MTDISIETLKTIDILHKLACEAVDLRRITEEEFNAICNFLYQWEFGE